MKYYQIFIVYSTITTVQSKRHSSSESIENLLYYQDCSHKKTTTQTPMIQRAGELQTPRPTDCPFPRMCCTMSCGNECVPNQQSYLSRQMEPIQNIQPIQPIQTPRQPHHLPVQPQINQRGRKNKIKLPPKMQIPLDGRREFGFTKEKIKNLISHDDDIRKILKDLVRVTMQKVDLMDMVNARRKMNDNKNSETSHHSDEDYELDY